MDAYLDGWANYFKFSGRARRREYWSFVLINGLVSAGLAVGNTLATQSDGVPIHFFGVLAMFFSLAVGIPSLSAFVRRMHDTGRSGWWLFISLLPLIGSIIQLVFLLQDGEPGENKYGVNPKTEMG